MSNILVIHGFNSGPGNKSELLKQAFPNSVVFTPQLNNQPIEDLKLLQEFIDTHSDIHVVGTSLGGFYTMYLALTNSDRDDLSFYMINPSYNPYSYFKTFLNQEFTNYKTNLTIVVNNKLLDELMELETYVHKNFENKPNMYFYFGTKDDVLNHKILIKKIYSFKTPNNMFTSSQDHRHENIDNVIEQIKLNSVL